MKQAIIYGSLLTLSILFSGSASAREDALDRDPFFSDKPRAGERAAPSAQGDVWGRDPFSRPFDDHAPARRTVARASGMKLSGIIYSETRRVAIIDGETAGEGGVVGDRRITAIKRRSVVLSGRTGGAEELFIEDFTIGK